MSDAPEFRCLVRGIPGAEGPLVDRTGTIFMVAPSEGNIVKVLPNGATEVFAHTGGKPAGLQLHRDGDIWVADMALGILRVTPSGEVIDEVVQYRGSAMRGCNDLIFDSIGNLYFTAPAGSNGKPGGATGEIFFRSREGTVERLDGGFAFPNGIAISAGDDLLIFAETFTHKLIAYDVEAPGKVSNRRDWAILPTDGGIAGGDGMDFDAECNLVATNYSAGTLEVYRPGGEHARTISLPFKKCSNVHFNNPTSHRMLVTEHENNALWEFDYGSAGQMQFGWRA